MYSYELEKFTQVLYLPITGIASHLRIVVRSPHGYPNVFQTDNSECFFSRRRFKDIYTRFCHAVQLPYVTLRFTWQTLQTSLQLFSFFGRPLFAFTILQRSSNIISFSPANSENKKYENLLAPLHFAAKKRRNSDWIILTARHSTVE